MIAAAHLRLSAIALVAAGGLCGCPRKQEAKAPTPPPVVLVTEVKPQDVPIFLEFVGTLEGLVNADIQARVSGYLTSQNYKEGTDVKKGDLLFQIDPRPFQAALAKAQASLEQMQASARQAALTAQRNVELYERKAVSTQERDNAVQQSRAMQAQMEAQQAAVKQAQLDFDFTNITAPIEGIAGIAKAQVGDLVGPSTGVLTSISTVNPIKAYFTISEQRYTQYMARYSDPKERAAHEKELQFQLILADGSLYPNKGEFYARDREIDTRTGSFRIAAVFPNPGNVLRPGQFARVRVQTETRPNALMVPQRAVTEMQGLYSVDVVDANGTAHIRPVVPGTRIGSDWIIEHGLTAGDRVVVEGVQKVQDGGPVSAKPWSIPAPAAAGAPAPVSER